MSTDMDRTFLFHADASPLGGVVTSINPGDLQTFGSSSLAQTGGYAKQREVPNFQRFDKLVRATTAHSHVTGHKTPEGWISEVCSTVEDFDLQGVITAKKLVAHLVVHHPLVGYSPTVEFTESEFVDLRVNGQIITPTIDRHLYAREVDPPEAALGSWIDDPEMVGSAVRHCRLMTSAAGAPEWVKERYGWMQSKKKRKLQGHVVCSLVSRVDGLTSGRSFGHVMDVPKVGRLVLGELRVDQGSFALTMLRVEMACQDQGSVGNAAPHADAGAGQAAVTVATAHSNGRPYP